MTARKSPTKKTTKKASTKASSKKASTKKASAKKATTKKAAKKATAKKASGDVAPDGVNMGHVFALRPRVTTAFSPEAMRRAKEELREERYASIGDAARAVAEKALELSQKKSGKNRIGAR